MSESRFTELTSDLLLGQPLKEFACLYCGEAAQAFVAMALRADTEKPSIVLAYGLCNRCGSLYWNEAGEKFFKELKADLP